MQLFFLVCLLLLSPQGASPRRHHPREMRKKVKEPLVEATAAPSRRDFAFDLYRALASTTPGQNVFFSPLSISLSLAMLALGARSNTKTQILEGLGLDLQARSEDEVHHGFQQLLHELTQPREDLQLSLGNTLFIDRKLDIQDAFLSAIRTLYLADAFSTDFEDFVGAKKQINDYVAKQTKGKVVELLKHLDGTQVMVMVNYIFFKAKWEMSFSPEDTREHDFHVRPEASVRVPMMNREDQYLYFLDRNLSCMVLGLRYQGNATALFILPEEGKMRQVEEGLSEKTLRKWLKMFTKRQLDLYLPKFSIKGSYQLDKILPRLGISDVFTSHANLSAITSHSNIQVSEMVHKAVVEVDESGTKAAAATASIFLFRSVRIGVPTLMFNRPFLLLIVDGHSNILFAGKVVQP
ncbi:plasma serine protease inhibitor [Oryctolagus cuniculus]|uniref:plasma serine protease inhibitor n=1 Tax=Oryctolagus cuniculus TaxID=9986 RepID=UPI0022300773|nr:plasma serine protease inhibitor [Oryctolagus cuniculus]XP_051695084.1 plasma serine protease inhibitor [Oryctolagus cuniculus]